MRSRTKSRAAATAAAAVLVLAPRVDSASFTWDGGALLGDQWSRDNNWSSNNAPPSDGTADLFFAGSERRTPEADANWSIRSITFNSGATGFTISGSTLTIGNGGITNNSISDQSINNTIVLGSPQTFDNSSGSLRLFGNVNLNGNALTFNPAAVVVDVHGVVSGSGGITVNGAGVTRFLGTAANTYGGTTTLGSGSLLLRAPSPNTTLLPGTAIVGNGTDVAQLQVSVSSEQIANGSAITVNAGSVFEVDVVSETIGALTVNAGGNARGENNGTLTTTTLTMTGGTVGSALTANTFALNGNVTTNANASAATIQGTTLNLNNATRTFTVADGTAAHDLQISSAIINGSLTKSGAGTLRLTGTTNNAATVTTVNAGTLELDKTGVVNAVSGSLVVGDGVGTDVAILLAANQIANTTSVTLTEGTLDMNGFSDSIGSLTINGGNVSNAPGTGTLTLGGNVTVASGGDSSIACSLSLGGVTRTFSVADVAVGSDLTVSRQISNGGLTKTGAGTLELSAANTYTGSTIVTSGTLLVTNANAVNTGQPVTVDVGATLRVAKGLATALDIGALNMHVAGRIDLNDGAIVRRNGGSGPTGQSTTQQLTARLRSGLENGGNFDWQGLGISSTEAFNDNAAAGSVLFGVGVIQNNVLAAGSPNATTTDATPGNQVYNSFKGRTVGLNDTLVRYTYMGDADLSGNIDGTDYSLIDAGFGASLSGWLNGDFDYSGSIDGTDYALIDNAFGAQTGVLPDQFQAMVAEHAALFGQSYVDALAAVQSGVVPEPTTMGILAVGGVGLMRRRRPQ